MELIPLAYKQKSLALTLGTPLDTALLLSMRVVFNFQCIDSHTRKITHEVTSSA